MHEAHLCVCGNAPIKWNQRMNHKTIELGLLLDYLRYAAICVINHVSILIEFILLCFLLHSALASKSSDSIKMYDSHSIFHKFSAVQRQSIRLQNSIEYYAWEEQSSECIRSRICCSAVHFVIVSLSANYLSFILRHRLANYLHCHYLYQ